MTNQTFVLYDSDGAIKQIGYGEPEIQDTGDLSLLVCDLPDDISEYKVANGVLTEKTQAEKDAENAPLQWVILRKQRDQLLSSSDWTQMPDSPLTDAKKAEWATYRQQLRDLPSTADPANPTWPSKPA